MSHLQKLERTCRLATRAARKAYGIGIEASVDAQSLQDAARWRDKILADLEPALEPWLKPPIPQGKTTRTCKPFFRLVRHAERFFDQCDLGQSVTVGAVAEALGVSPRTLFHAFGEWVGMGPYAYFQLVRLHRLRERLLAGSSTDTSVTELASELGFCHLGRLSAAYHAHFGEYPSETLKRPYVVYTKGRKS
jgi:AraC-like DNA-binding protein